MIRDTCEVERFVRYHLSARLLLFHHPCKFLFKVHSRGIARLWLIDLNMLGVEGS